jgi:hypothetical protein
MSSGTSLAGPALIPGYAWAGYFCVQQPDDNSLEAYVNDKVVELASALEQND